MIRKEYPQGGIAICVGRQGQIFTRENIDGRLVYFEWLGKNNGLPVGGKIEIRRLETFMDHGSCIESGFPESQRKQKEQHAKRHWVILEDFCQEKEIKIIDLSDGLLSRLGKIIPIKISDFGY